MAVFRLVRQLYLFSSPSFGICDPGCQKIPIRDKQTRIRNTGLIPIRGLGIGGNLEMRFGN